MPEQIQFLVYVTELHYQTIKPCFWICCFFQTRFMQMLCPGRVYGYCRCVVWPVYAVVLNGCGKTKVVPVDSERDRAHLKVEAGEAWLWVDMMENLSLPLFLFLSLCFSLSFSLHSSTNSL